MRALWTLLRLAGAVLLGTILGYVGGAILWKVAGSSNDPMEGFAYALIGMAAGALLGFLFGLRREMRRRGERGS